MLVQFPGLGIQLHINRIAFSLFGIDIYWYAIFIVLGIILAFIILKMQDGKFGIHFENILDLSIYLIPISFLSARLYYCIFSPSFLENPLQFFNFRTGGLAIYGGVIGGVITFFVYCQKKKIHFLDLCDLVVPCLALAQAIGRWGNFFNIEAYGTQTNLPWRMGIIENGIYKEVHPTFLYESIATFSIFVILMIKNKKRKFSGETTYLYFILYSIVRFLIEGLRTDSLMFLNLRISQIVSIILFAVSCIMLSKNKIKQKRKNQNEVK